MKNIRFLIFSLAVIIGLSSCSDSWLNNELNGETISQEDFDKLTSTTEGSIKGLYSMLYSRFDDEHHNFGQKSIDIATDFMSGDMAMSADAYGWFTSDAMLLGASATGSRNSFMWTYYYQIIMNSNLVIRKLLNQQNTIGLTQMDKYYFAQAYTMRAYAYFNLLNFYTPGRTDSNAGFMGGTGMGYRAVPIYNETTFNDKGLPKEQDLSTKAELIAQIHNDLNASIGFFNELDPDSVPARTNKLWVNKDIARVYLAYTYMIEENWHKADSVANDIIDNPVENYSIIPLEDVTTTGFVSVSDPSWMWGMDVTVETTGGLASFWGHMDVFTYSYAQAGAMKIIDDNLYKSMPDYDKRKEWFDKTKLNPSWKFYDLKRGTGANLDRRWLNDVVYMRYEEVILIAAESALRAGDAQGAKEKLKMLVADRYVVSAENDPVAAIDAMDNAALEAEIEYNWRIELWGEGRSLMTFKRFGNMHKTGSQRVFLKNEDLQPTDQRILFRLPSGELSTNMAITYPDSNN